MDYIELLKSFNQNTAFKKSDGYYFIKHKCEKTGDTSKIMLDYTLSSDTTDEIMRFGFCRGCGICFYHCDYQSRSF